MDIQELLGNMTVEQTQELIVEALSILSAENATDAIVDYADEGLEELAEELADRVDREG